LKALITGARGLLGQELSSILPGAAACDHASLDVTDESRVWRVLTNRKFDVVFHCAAMTDVDACESDPARARLVNAVGSRNVASTCASLGIYLVAISTDYVFDGKSERELREDAVPKPASIYGKTKLEGEIAVRDIHPAAAVVRTSWLYGHWRPTFTDRVLVKGAAGEQMSISHDQVSSPTSVMDLAPALVRLATRRSEGIFHLVNEGHTSRDDWARTVLSDAGLDTTLVHAVNNYPAPARRPHYSALTNIRARGLGIVLPPWRESVQAYVESERGGNGSAGDKSPSYAAG